VEKASHGWALAALAVVVTLTLVDTAGGESDTAVVVTPHGPTLTFRATVRPKALRQDTPTPIALELDGHVGVAGSFFVPTVGEFVLDLDRHVVIDSRGLPVCQGPQLDIRGDDLGSRCPDAIVGKGRVEFLFQGVDLPPTPSAGELIVVNSDSHRAGETTLKALAFLTQPITTAVVIDIAITRRPGGDRAVVKVPEVANGTEALTDLSIRLKRRFTRNGKAIDLLTATCPAGTIRSTLDAFFQAGAKVRRTSRQTCVPRPG
jgi:hypothetical protein